MLKSKLMEQINNDNHYTISKYVLIYAKKMNLDMNSLILLIYFLNKKNNDIFDYKKILKELLFSEKELLEAISLLKDKKILSIEMKQNESGILEERVNISSFYDIIYSMILNDEKTIASEKNLYDSFEKEFGRTLSPMEFDIINNWTTSGISNELILAALKETVFNGVNNLRYVDKILFEWNRKGIKSPKDIEDKIKQNEEEKQESCYEYDWLNE